MDTLEKTDCLLTKLDFGQTNSFSSFFLDYISGKDDLKAFHNGLPSPENLLKQIDQRNFSDETRATLSSSLKGQYEQLDVSELTEKNMASLARSNTYTITTGHQLNIFTGPLYVIYKIVTVIRACEELSKLRPDCNFVPVYWMASEDHDFDEINHFRFNGKKFSWDTDQTGAVGRFETKSIAPIFDEIIGIPNFFAEAYLKSKNLAEAVRKYMNHLFGEYGLVIIDSDAPELKAIFSSVIEADIFDHTPETKATETTKQLENLGYKTQVFPRQINFFYLKDDLRARIERDEDQFVVVDTDIRFSSDEMRREIQEYPERFSPNVVLRPLYQEFLLPNLAYVGGPSELVYWLQLKGVFDHFNTAFPLLMPRSFAGVLTSRIQRKIEQASLSFEDLFKEVNSLIKEKVKNEATFNLDLQNQKDRLKEIFGSANQQAKEADTTLEQLVLAEHRRAEKSMEKIEKKILRAEKRNQEVLVDRIHTIKDTLFPGGSPQERKDNFLNFYLANDKFLDSCMEALDPFDYRFHLLLAHE